MKLLFPLIALMFFTSCASKKPDNNPVQSAPNETELILNGSSDTNSAGNLRTVHFDFTSSALSPQSKRILDENKEFLENNPKISIQIEGHCDDRGGPQFNLALGQQRAKAVKDYLRAKGISPRKMTIFSYGKEKPLEDGISEDSRSRNRRANFVITSM